MALQILKDNGINYIRLRIWVKPANGYNNKEKVLLYAKKIKDLGLNGDIKSSGWLVGDQKIGPIQEGDRDYHPLAHAARQLMWIGAQQTVGIGQTDRGEAFLPLYRLDWRDGVWRHIEAEVHDPSPVRLALEEPVLQIIEAINRHYGASDGESADSMLQEFTDTAIDFTETAVEQAANQQQEDNADAPVVKLVNLIITEAVQLRASDIHIEPFEDRVRIRYRIDGRLVERDNPPRRLLGAILSRIKILSKLDIAERRRPQDGRIKLSADGKDYDLRVSVLLDVENHHNFAWQERHVIAGADHTLSAVEHHDRLAAQVLDWLTRVA